VGILGNALNTFLGDDLKSAIIEIILIELIDRPVFFLRAI
jgi:hypothetical protein